jgi:hypothetical protein
MLEIAADRATANKVRPTIRIQRDEIRVTILS